MGKADAGMWLRSPGGYFGGAMLLLLGSEVAELGREVCCCCSPVKDARERPVGGGGMGAAEGVLVARGGGPVCAATAGVTSLVPVDAVYGFVLGAKGGGAICLVGGGALGPNCDGAGCDPGAGA